MKTYKGTLSTSKLDATLDFKKLTNVPQFAEEPETSTSILNEVNRAKAAEAALDLKISTLKTDIEQNFGGTFAEIREVYGNLQAVKDDFESINDIVSTMNSLKEDIEEAFGGTFAEIKEVYGNLQAVKDDFDSINDVIASMNQPTNALSNQILTSRINNLEQIMFQLK